MRKDFWNRKAEFKWNRLIRTIAIIIIHFIILDGLIFTLYGIDIAIGHSVSDEVSEKSTLILYFMFIAPGVNAFCHLAHRHNGSIFFRMLLWVHTLFIIIVVPILIFFF